MIRRAVAASVAQVSAENIHHAPADPPAGLPGVLVLNLAPGVTYTCRLQHGAYSCVLLRHPARGPR